MFEVCLTNGYFFKSYIDFLATCVQTPENKCWLRVDEDGLKIEYTTDKQERNRCHIFILLERAHFNNYTITKNVEINIEPKQLQKICRNIKKKDKLIFTFYDETPCTKDTSFDQRTIFVTPQLKLLIYNEQFCGKEEIKEIPFSSHYEKKEEKIIEKPTDFYKFPFTVSSDAIQNVKKVIGVKKEPVEITILKDEVLIFSGLSQGISPFIIKYPQGCPMTMDTLSDKNVTKLVLSGSVVSILSKLAQMTKNIHFHQHLSNEKHNLLKITAKLDVPYYMGNVEIIVFETPA